jgi:hypothetical protein
MQRSPEAAALLNAWEQALSQPRPERAPSLLVSLGWVDDANTLTTTTIGSTDTRLFALRELLFGPTLACVVSCPECGETIEFGARCGDLVTAGGQHGGAPVTVLGGPLLCRLPVNGDIHRLNRNPAQASPRTLLQMCLLGELATLDAVSDGDCDRAVAQLADADPGACVEMAIDCPCSYSWIEEFDIRSYLMSELTDWAVRSLRDIHQLASRYGWSESDILRMSPWRKQIYLEACAAS